MKNYVRRLVFLIFEEAKTMEATKRIQLPLTDLGQLVSSCACVSELPEVITVCSSWLGRGFPSWSSDLGLLRWTSGREIMGFFPKNIHVPPPKIDQKFNRKQSSWESENLKEEAYCIVDGRREPS